MGKGAQWSPNGQGLMATREDLGQAPRFARPPVLPPACCTCLGRRTDPTESIWQCRCRSVRIHRPIVHWTWTLDLGHMHLAHCSMHIAPCTLHRWACRPLVDWLAGATVIGAVLHAAQVSRCGGSLFFCSFVPLSLVSSLLGSTHPSLADPRLRRASERHARTIVRCLQIESNPPPRIVE